MKEGMMRVMHLYSGESWGERPSRTTKFCREMWGSDCLYGGSTSEFKPEIRRGSFFPLEWKRPFFNVFVHDGSIDPETIEILQRESGCDDMVVIDLSKEPS